MVLDPRVLVVDRGGAKYEEGREILCGKFVYIMSKERSHHPARTRTWKEGPELEASVNSLQEWAKRMGCPSLPSAGELRA